MSLDPNRLILTGENPFIRLSDADGGVITTNASFWRILVSPAGAGHVLYLKSDLTQDRWKIYSDNIAMARWLQKTVQGMLNEELSDTSIPVTDAAFDTGYTSVKIVNTPAIPGCGGIGQQPCSAPGTILCLSASKANPIARSANDALSVARCATSLPCCLPCNPQPTQCWTTACPA